MRFVWDEVKNRANKAKHGVRFEIAKLVFDDPLHVSVPDRHERGQESDGCIVVECGENRAGNGQPMFVKAAQKWRDPPGLQSSMYHQARQEKAHPQAEGPPPRARGRRNRRPRLRRRPPAPFQRRIAARSVDRAT